MKRRNFLQTTAAGLAASSLLAHAQGDKKPPNMVWITCEDMSPNLGCFGDPQARTPNLDALAEQGVRYSHAFSVAGVCAPSRSGLITGVYPTSLGTLHMRCRNQPPDTVKCFPEYLQQSGYYCTNNSKEDYNFKPPATAWNESSNKAHFRNRPDKDQPFFAVFNFTITHESKIGTLPPDLGQAERALLAGLEPHDPNAIQVPPFYPSTPVIQRHWAHYYDLIEAMDRQAGEILKQLEQDGLAENTVVFFYSDHGVGAPECKRWMYDRGTRVPLIIRWPGTIEPGTATDRLVSFVDFAPTALSIAGVSIPGHMQGTPFLGQSAGKPREYIHSARDRMDERYDIIRAVRDSRWKYIRNYEPQIPYDLPLTYPESFPIMQDLRRVEKEEGFSGPPALFFQDRKPVEELYDTEADPDEFNNLSEQPEAAEALDRMRKELDRWMLAAHDLGMVPEFELHRWLPMGTRPEPIADQPRYAPLEGEPGKLSVFGRTANEWVGDLNEPDPLIRYRAIKSIGILGAPMAPVLSPAMQDPDSAVSFWAARAMGEIENHSPEVRDTLIQALHKDEAGPALGAAYAMIRQGEISTALPRVLELMSHENGFVRLRGVALLETIGKENPQVEKALQAALDDKEQYVVRIAKQALGIPGR